MHLITNFLFMAYIYTWFYIIVEPIEEKTYYIYTLCKKFTMEELKYLFRIMLLCYFFKTVQFYHVLKGVRNNIVLKIKQYIFNSVTPLEDNRFKVGFYINNDFFNIIIKKNAAFDNVMGVYTEDYTDCITEEVLPFYKFCHDSVKPSDINCIYGQNQTQFIVTYKNNEIRTIVTDEHSYNESVDASDTDEPYFLSNYDNKLKSKATQTDCTTLDDNEPGVQKTQTDDPCVTPDESGYDENKPDVQKERTDTYTNVYNRPLYSEKNQILVYL